MENNTDIIPVFYDHSSQKSLIVPWLPSETKEGGPVSMFTLAKEANLKEVYMVSRNFHAMIEAMKNADKLGFGFRFGLEVWVTDSLEKNEQSTNNESKIIIWMRNSQSYKDLIRLYSKIYTNPDLKYYHFRADFGLIRTMWTDNLILSLPFFDNFAARNFLHYGAAIIPDFPCKPIIQREINTGLPFEGLLNQALDRYNSNKEFEEIKTKTILYKDYEDSVAWQVYSSIKNRASFSKPEADHCSSRNFCWTDYKKLVGLT